MVPTGVASLLLFLLVVVPGLAYDLLSERRRAAEPESAFREASRVGLASVIFTGASLAVLSIVRAAWPNTMPDPRRLLFSGQEAYLAGHYRLVGRALVLEVLLALLFAGVAHGVLNRRGLRLDRRAAWVRVFRVDVPTGHAVHVRVQLRTGTVYFGRVALYSPSSEDPDRALVLAPPLAVKEPQGQRTPLHVAMQRLVLEADAIESVEVSYLPDATVAVRSARGSRKNLRKQNQKLQAQVLALRQQVLQHGSRP